MALKYADRTAESTVTVGTGDIMLAGPIDADHDSFANQFADGDTMPVVVFGGGKWMTFEGRYNSGANSITRINFRDSSTGSPIALSGTMTVMCAWGAADAAAVVAAAAVATATAAAAVRTDTAQSFSDSEKTRAQQNLGLAAVLRNYLAGLAYTAGGSSNSFTIAPGVAADKANTDMMSLSAALTKTNQAWSVGAGGSVDVGANTAASAQYNIFLIKRPDTGATDILASRAPGMASAVTISNASPGVVTWTDHGLRADCPLKFSTTGVLPTGLTAGTQYYVKTVTSVDTFTVTATPGGAVINTSSAGSGVHTASAFPVLPANYTIFRRILSTFTDGIGNFIPLIQRNDDFFWATPIGDVANASPNTAGLLHALTVPRGIKSVQVKLRGLYGNTATSGTQLLVHSPLEANQTANSPPGNGQFRSNGIAEYQSAELEVWTDNSSQVRSISTASSGDQLWLVTSGWLDRRDRDA